MSHSRPGMTLPLGFVLAISLAAMAPASAQTDTFASKTVTIMVPFPPGGTSDVVTRVIAAKVADSLKATVVIDNRSGGGGVVAAIATKQAVPDGTTLFLANNGLFAVTPAISADVRFDPVKDFQPITPLVLFPSVLIVPASSPAHTLKELVEYGKSKPSGLSFASQGIGSGGQIMGELLRLKTGLRMVHVPYRGAGPATQDVAGGNIDMLFTSYVSAAGQIQGGKVRVIAFTGRNRSPILPDVPTAAEQGFAGIEMDVWHGVVAPAGTPPAIVQHLNAEFVKAAQSPDVVKMVAAQAADILTSTPEEFARLIAKDIDRLGGAVRAAGIKAQ
jgi:tripartite-type tricarboxylate transporter receptor subunit TctC